MFNFWFDKIVESYRFLGKSIVTTITISIIASFFLFFIEIFSLFILQGFFVSLGLLERSVSFLPDWYPSNLAISLIFLASLGLFRSGLTGWIFYLQGMARQDFLYLNRNRIISHALRFPAKTTVAESVSNISDIANRGGESVRSFAGVVVQLILAVAFFSYGCYLSFKEFFIATMVLGIIFGIMKFFDLSIASLGDGLAVEWRRINRILINGLKHNLLLKVYGLIDEEVENSKKSLEQFRNHYRKYLCLTAIRVNTPTFVGILIICAVTYVGLTYFKTSGVVLVSLFYLFGKFVQSVGQLVSALSGLKLNLPAVKVLYDIFKDCRKDLLEVAGTKKITDDQKRDFHDSIASKGVTLSVDGVYFKYDEGSEYVLRDISIDADKGDVVVITGNSGCGKSTFLSVVLGTHLPSKGDVLINGFEINTILPELSSYVGYVSSDPFWFSGFLRDILLYGHKNSNSITDEDIYQCLKIVEIEGDVLRLEKGLDTYMGEQGELSTGQKQRLAIARALLRNPKLLVLDEFTSNLDNQTEQKIIDNMEKIFPETTCLVVTHRMKLVDVCTQHIVL